MSSDPIRPRTAVPDAYGERDLWIGPCQGDNPSPGHVEIFASQVWCGSRVTLINAMHEAPGLPAPVILDRPAIPGTCFEMFGTSFSLSPDGSLRVTRVGGHLRAGHQYEPSEVRRWAGYLAALADEAERRQVPDPELVRQMTADLHAAGAGIKDPELLEVARRMALMGWRRGEDGAR